LFFSPATSCKTLSVLREDAAEIFVFSFSLTKQFCALFCSALLYSVVVVVVVFILFSTLPPPIGRRCLSSPQKKKKTMTA
jgi:hypothetical protein